MINTPAATWNTLIEQLHVLLLHLKHYDNPYIVYRIHIQHTAHIPMYTWAIAYAKSLPANSNVRVSLSLLAELKMFLIWFRLEIHVLISSSMVPGFLHSANLLLTSQQYASKTCNNKYYIKTISRLQIICCKIYNIYLSYISKSYANDHQESLEGLRQNKSIRSR